VTTLTKLYESLAYFPFGETWIDRGPQTQRLPYRYTAQELDQDTQLYYYGARYYDPRTSVWESPDPILGQYLTGKPNGGVYRSENLNLYAYASQDPMIYIDPDGNAVFKNGAALLRAGKAVLKNPIVQPRHGNTYCNIGTNLIEQRGGANPFKGMMANAIVNQLKKPSYATRVSPSQAVNYANQGVTVIAAEHFPVHGHVAIVAPLPMGLSGSTGKMVPRLFNVGPRRYFGIKLSTAAFPVHQPPNYYITNTDLHTLRQR